MTDFRTGQETDQRQILDRHAELLATETHPVVLQLLLDHAPKLQGGELVCLVCPTTEEDGDILPAIAPCVTWLTIEAGDMGQLHYTPLYHLALQEVAEEKIRRTDGPDGHYVYTDGTRVSTALAEALRDLRHAGLTAWDHGHLPPFMPVRVLLTFSGAMRLSSWRETHQAGAA